MSKKLTLHHLELIWAKVKSIVPDVSEFITGSEVDAKILPVATRVTTIEGKESGWDAKYSKPSTGIPKTDLASAVQTSLTKADNAIPNTTTHLSGDIATTEKGAANGVASLGSDGKVPSSQLPSYVDDVLEYDSKSAFPTTGESGKIYIDKSDNKTYRWSGSAYVEISQSLALGETSSTAYAGNKGKANADAIASIQQILSDIATIRSNASNGATAYSWGNHASAGYIKGITKAMVDAVISYQAPITSTNKLAASLISGLANVAISGSYNDLNDKPSIPSPVTEEIVAGWGFTKNTGTYIKPSTGIPKSDLASAVQTSLGKADSAIQNVKTINGQSIVGTGNIDIQPGTDLPLSVINGMLCITYNN